MNDKFNNRLFWGIIGVVIAACIILIFITTYDYSQSNTVTEDVLISHPHPLKEYNINTQIKQNEIKKYKDEQKLVKNEKEVNDGFIYYSNIELSRDIQRYIFEICNKRQVSFELMLAIANVETGGTFNPNLVSSTTDYGLYQLNKKSGTLEWLANWTEKEFDNIHNFNWKNPKHNASAAVLYVDWLRDQWQGYSEEDKFAYVLLSYNYGLNGARNYLKNNDVYDWDYVNKVLKYKLKLEKGEV